MRAPARRGSLLGRQTEQQLLAALLTAVRAGRSGVVVISGEAGIGKTALLTDLLAQASDLRAIQISGAESEMELAYAGVHQLCAPLLSRVGQLPKPQENAIQIALGLSEGDAPNGLLVGLAVLTLLGIGSAERPIICIVDDVQWVDRASLQTLAFVARRILAEPVLMIFAGREVDRAAHLDGLPQMILTGLDDRDANSLLAAALPGRLEAHMRENIIAEAGGNPLALLELPRALTPVELAGGYGLANAKPVPTRIEQTFANRFRELPSQTQTLLLIAAAEPTGEPAWLWATAESLGIGVDAEAPAETAGLITTDGRLRFRHPLVRSAVYRSASAAERRRTHKALAEAITGPTAADHRSWHRAHAAGAPDEEVADELVHSAERARARGGVAAAAAFLSFAVELTPDTRRRAKRALDASQAKLDAGDPETACRLLTIADDAVRDPLLSARVDLQRAKLAFAASRGSDGPPLLLAAAKRLTELDPLLARETYLEALMSSIIVGRLSADEKNSALAVARAAQHAPSASSRPRAVDQLLDGLVVRLIEGYVAAAPLLKAAIDHFVLEEEAGTADPRWHDVTNRVLLDLFDPDAYDSLTARQLDKLRAAGALSLLPVALTTQAGMRVTRGEFSEAAALLEEAEVITTAIGAPTQRYIEPNLAANRGQEHLTRKLVTASIDGARQRGEGFAISVALYSAAIMHNGLCQYAEALAACRSALEYDDFGMSSYLLVEMVEAAARCGEMATAASALERLVERTDASGTDSARGLATRSKALLADGEAVETQYLTAIAHLERSPMIVYLARTKLVYGEWLRRKGRRVDARGRLRSAFEMFSGMGAEGFAERTRRELEATGETVRKRSKASVVELTTQERYIVRLARAGYTNSEIGGQLFISPRTVEWHLSKVFTKLDVTSRKDLRNLASDVL
jgi:DNA-binding CsgD family transcriptional regulator/tetratricopeptide (TPR) repeat protein